MSSFFLGAFIQGLWFIKRFVAARSRNQGFSYALFNLLHLPTFQLSGEYTSNKELARCNIWNFSLCFLQKTLCHKPHGPWACLKNCPWYPPALSNIGDQFLGLKFSQFSGQNEMGNTYDWLGGPNRFFWGSGHWWAWEGSFNLTQPMGILCLWNFWDLHIW